MTGIDLELGGVAIRAGDLPLLRRSPDGLRQCVRLAVSAREPRGRARFSLFSAAGRRLDTTTVELDAATTTVRLFAPVVDRPTFVRLESELDAGLRRSDELKLLPQRRWRVHLVHHSHFDLGYTDPQAQVLRHQLAYLDAALDLAAAHDGFRWTVESNLPLERWLAVRPEAARKEFLDHLRSGRFEACALPFTMHAEALSIDELARQLRFARELRSRHGVEVVTAMQTDVPGAPPGLPLVLAAAGVRYLAVAHNWAARAAPYLTGGESLPRAFQWSTESGNGVLVWHTDSPHGIAYLEGNLLGLADSYADATDLLPEYLAALALRGYPYAQPHETLGVPDAGVRAPYPFDLLHLRVQGLLADNAAPSLVPAQIAAAWAEEFAYPQLVPSGNREFFEQLEERHGGELQTFRGDWADWWADGLGSAAREVGFNRRAQATVRTAQTLHVMADALTGTDPGWAGAAEAVYERMELFDEHTWCAAHPGGSALIGRESGALQWQTKAALAVDASDRADALLSAAAGRFRASRGDSILVLNASGHARSDVVEVFVPASRVDSGRHLAVVDVERNERVPHAFGPPEPSRNRRQGRVLSFVAHNVPGLGYRRFTLVEDGANPPADVAGVPGVLENEHYRLELDVDGGHAVRLLDLEVGLDVVDAASAFGFAQVVRDLYGGALQATRRASGGVPVTHAEGRRDSSTLITARSVPADGVVCERMSNGVEERVAIRTRADGFELIETSFRLLRGIRRLDISVLLLKHPTTEKEGVHLVFPFATRDPRIAYELTGGVGGGPCVPGSAAHVHAIRHWVSLQGADETVTWSTLQAPLVQLGNLFLPYPPYPETIDGAGAGMVTSWVMNNVWDTNFPLAQGGEVRFDYAVSSAGPGAEGRALGIETADALTRPLVGVLGATATEPAGGLCELEAQGVEVVMLTRADGTVAAHLQSYAAEEVGVRLSGQELRVAPGDYVVVPLDL